MPYGGGHPEQAAPNQRRLDTHSNLRKGKLSTVRGKRKHRRGRRK
jgi:hypothetical protein